MANYTEHYQLHQWEPTDDFLRTDFNTDFAKIDAALGEKADTSDLAEKCGAVTGTYTGDGAANRTITLGFQPEVLLLFRQEVSGSSDRYPLLLFPGYTCISNRSNLTMLQLTGQGFTVRHGVYDVGSSIYSYTPDTNESGALYYYVVITLT